MDTDEENTTKYRKIRDAFNMFDTNTSGTINISHVRMAVRLLANQNLSENEVLALRSEPVVDSNGTIVEDCNRVSFTFDQFYAIASKYLPPSEDKYDYRNGFDTGGRTTYRPGVGGRSPPLCSSQECSTVETTRSPKTTDIYLAGDSGDDIRWMEDIAISMIRKSKLTYHAAASTDLSVLLDARTVLFVISNSSRALAPMTLAAYCIAKKPDRVVLCIQNLNNDDCVIRGEKLTQTAINDYNRGRMYLADLATREQVPVFESITEAVELAIQKSL